MKKNGFTLAEVLITLAIIGVVATLTLPALMTNTQEQQAITGLKKGLNTLSEAGQMNNAIAGFDYGSVTSTDWTDKELQSLYGLFVNRTNVDLANSTVGNAANKTDKVEKSASNYVIFFRDGMALSVSKNAASTPSYKNNADDGLPIGIPAVLDINGVKGPNLLSNCAHNFSIVPSTTGRGANDTIATGKTCNDKSERVIKDQFSIRLRGAYAVPNGPAARWALAN